MDSELAPLRMDGEGLSEEKTQDHNRRDEVKVYQDPSMGLKLQTSMVFDPESNDRFAARPKVRLPKFGYNDADCKSFTDDLDYDGGMELHETSPSEATLRQQTDPYNTLITQINSLQTQLYPKEKIVLIDSKGIDENILVQTLPENLQWLDSKKYETQPKYELSRASNILLGWDLSSITLIKLLESGKPANTSTTFDLRRLFEQVFQTWDAAIAKEGIEVEEKPKEKNPEKPNRELPRSQNFSLACADETLKLLERYLSSTNTKNLQKIYHATFSRDSTSVIIFTSVAVLIFCLKKFQVSYLFTFLEFPEKAAECEFVKHTSEHKREFGGVSSITSTATEDYYFQVGQTLYHFDYQAREYMWFGQISNYRVNEIYDMTGKEEEECMLPDNLKFNIVLGPRSIVKIYEQKSLVFEQSDDKWITTLVYLDGPLPDPKEYELQGSVAPINSSSRIKKEDFSLACVDSRERNDRETKILAYESVSQQLVRISLGDSKRFLVEPVALNLQHLSPQDLPTPSTIISSSDLRVVFIDYAGEHWKVFTREDSEALSYREMMCSTSNSPARKNLIAPDLSYVLGIYNKKYSIFPLDLPKASQVSSFVLPKDIENINYTNLSCTPDGSPLMFAAGRVLFPTFKEPTPWRVVDYFDLISTFDVSKRSYSSKIRNWNMGFLCQMVCPSNPNLVYSVYAEVLVGKGGKTSRPLIFTIDVPSRKIIEIDYHAEIDDFAHAIFSSQGQSVLLHGKDSCHMLWFEGKKLLDLKGVGSESCRLVILDKQNILIGCDLSADKSKFVINVYTFQKYSKPELLCTLEHTNTLKGDLRGCKSSENEHTVVFFGDTCFAVLDLKLLLEPMKPESKLIAHPAEEQRRSSIRSIQEAGLGLNSNSLELSGDGDWIAVVRRNDQEAFLVDKLCKHSLHLCNPGDPQSRISFSFALPHRLIVFKTNSHEADIFELPDKVFPELVTRLGSLQLPRGFEIYNFHKTENYLIAHGTCAMLPKDLVIFKINISTRNLGLGPWRSMLMRYITADSQENQSKFAMSLRKTLDAVGQYNSQFWGVFCVSLYLLNHPGLFEVVYSEADLQTLLLRHPLLTLFYKFPKKESQRSILKLLQVLRTKSKRFARVCSTEFANLLKDEDARLLTKGLGADMLVNLMCGRMDLETISSELRNDTKTVIPYKNPQGKYLAAGLNPSGFAGLGLALESVNHRGLGKPGIRTAKIRTKRERIKDTLRPLLEEFPQNFSDYIPVQNLVPLDLRFGSEYSLLLFRTIETLDDERLQKFFGGFVYYKWNQIYPAALAYAALFWFEYILIYVHLGYYLEESWQTVMVLILASLFLLFELKCFLSNPKRYLRDAWNYWDIGIQVLSIVAVSRLSGATLANTTLSLNYLRTITVQVMGVRALTMLRVFRPTRYMITMVLEVFNDVLPFIPILILIMLVWALIWSLLPTLSVPPEPPESFYSALITPINIVFGNAPSNFNSNEFTPVQLSVLVGSCVVLALILMNFLIALIGSTFARISHEKGLYDLRELFPLLRDFDAAAKGLGFEKEGQAYFIGLLKREIEIDDLETLSKKVVESFELQMQKAVGDAAKEVLRSGTTVREFIRREGQLVAGKLEAQVVLREKKSNKQSAATEKNMLNERIKKIESALQSILELAEKPQNVT